MLVEFTVGNYRSIADKVTLSMIAAPIKSGGHAAKLDEENVIFIDDKLSLLKTVALYGANASGKSNVLQAIRTMGSFMCYSVQDADRRFYPYEPFLLVSGYAEQPAHFEIVFLMNGLQYRYGFEVSAARVEREWFYYVPKIREALLFEREQDTIKMGSSFRAAKGLEQRVTHKSLFLTVARDFNVEVAIPPFEWGDHFAGLFGTSDSESEFTIQCLKEKVYRRAIVNFMRQLDVDISDLEVTSYAENADEIRWNQRTIDKVETTHTMFNPQGEPIENIKFNMLHQESEGTQKLFAIAGPLAIVLDQGYILSFDEMDAKLHAALTRKIVELFQSKKTNPKNAQLIFATHDTNLLDNRLLRRDQIWFTEKNRKGATDLFSLAELKVRNDASYEKDYIQGRYGAIPFPGSFEHLFDKQDALIAS